MLIDVERERAPMHMQDGVNICDGMEYFFHSISSTHTRER